MRLKSWKIILMITGLTFIRSNAYIIDSKSVTPDKFYIQVGALMQQQSVDQLLKKLRHFPVWIHREGEMTKVFIVSNPRYKKAMLRKVHQLVPDAFVVKKNKISDLSETVSTVSSSPERYKNVRDTILPLNTKTILQTRKKFF